MMKTTRYVGLDVHADTIAAAIGEGRGKTRSLGEFPNRPESVRKFIEQLGGPRGLKICYEAGPTGYALYWQLTKLGVDCEVVAPSLIPRKPGEKIKTDRRDAEKLAQCYQSGTLTPVWVPDAAHEALPDLVRARSATKKDESRAKHRLVKYLLRNGLRHPDGSRAWTHPWWRWVQSINFEFEPQQPRSAIASLKSSINASASRGSISQSIGPSNQLPPRRRPSWKHYKPCAAWPS